MVDELEPSRNRFYQVTLLDKVGDVYPWDYHLMIVEQADDVLILEKSYVHSSWLEIKLPTGEVKRTLVWHMDPQPAFLAAPKSSMGDKHLWRGKEHFRSFLFCSDQLMQRVKKSKLKGLITYPITEE